MRSSRYKFASDSFMWEKIKSVFGIATSAALPTTAFFIKMAPPLLPEAALITAAIGGLLAGQSKSEPSESGARRNKAFFRFFCFVVFLVGYVLLLAATTVKPDDARGERVQCGLGMANMSTTTHYQRDVKPKGFASMREALAYEGMSDSGAAAIWQTWSIYTAGGALLVVFFLAVSCWAEACALAKAPPKPT